MTTTLKHILRLAAVALVLLPLAGCKHPEPEMTSFEFTGTIENFVGNDSKVYLWNEKYIMWEENDMVSITSDKCDGDYVGPAWLSHGSMGGYTDYNGVFNTDLPENSAYFMALHPFSKYNQIHSESGNKKFSDIKIYVPHEQTYRTDALTDLTFDRQMLPMIAHYDGNWASDPEHSDPFNLNFHTLATLVRLQFFNKTSDTRHIKQIVISSADATKRQLSGLFQVPNDVAHTDDPYLKELNSDPEGKDYNEIILSTPTGGVEFDPDKLLSFYVVLPALDGQDKPPVKLKLQVKLETTEGESFTKTITVDTRRKTITYMRSIGVTEFKTEITTGEAEQGLVGNGTEVRPFKIYTLAELNYMRAAFAAPRTDGFVYINGQKITKDSEFRLMRNDIVLDATWDEGIKDFVGHFKGNAVISTNTIVNNQMVPLFESIAEGGHVENITVKVSSSYPSNALSSDFSPFCTRNEGTMTSCKFTTGNANVVLTQNASYLYAGVCLINNGLLDKCGSGDVSMQFSRSDAQYTGVCGTNNASSDEKCIKACYASSDLKITSTAGGSGLGAASGVCHTNKGLLCECYYGASQTNVGATPWGGMVYENESTGRVEKSFFNGTLASTSSASKSAIGGLVCINRGRIDNCDVAEYSMLEGCYLGGIAASQEGSDAVVINCRIKSTTVTINHRDAAATHYCGGLVGDMKGGKLLNSFVSITAIGAAGSMGYQGSVIGRLVDGTVENCYGYSSSASTQPFCGLQSGGTIDANNYLLGTTLSSPSPVAISKDALNTLLSDLNGSIPTGGKSWTRNESSDSDVPTHEL